MSSVDHDYDDLYPLTTADHANGAEMFIIDALGNRDAYTDERTLTNSGYGPNNAANEYSTFVGGQLEYDAAGNLFEDEWNVSA